MLVCDMACVRFYVSLLLCLFVCVMSGFMEMFGPQGSVGFMWVIFVLSRTFVHRFVLSLSLYLSYSSLGALRNSNIKKR